MKRIAIAVASLMLVTMIGAAQAKPATVWEDAAGDSGLVRDGGTIEGTEQGGFDLVSGSIEKVKTDLVFTVTHSVMPPIGTLPETVRFLWAFAVDGESYRVTGKRTEIGKPNPINQSNTDQIGQVYPDGFFRLEGECGTTATVGTLSFIDCTTLGYLEGTFDPAAKTMSFSVPLEMVKAKKGSLITAGSGDSTGLCFAGGACWTSHVAERSSDRTVIDAAVITGTYKVR